MARSIAFISLGLLFMVACVSKEEKVQLEMENEELRAELNRANMTVMMLEEIGTLMDSIDLARSDLNIELEAGTHYDDYVARMENINEYVKDTESKILQLENELNQSSSKSQAYIRTINRMKRELGIKTNEIDRLKETAEKFKEENVVLLNVVDLQEAQILDLNDEIQVKMEELELIENKVQEMMKKAQMNEADSYFALGEALEEAAKRTKLAPKKKKETYSEAIEYYKKSLAFGREDAQQKIEDLQKKI